MINVQDTPQITGQIFYNFCAENIKPQTQTTPHRDLAHVTGSYTRNKERVGDVEVLLKAMLKHSADAN